MKHLTTLLFSLLLLFAAGCEPTSVDKPAVATASEQQDFRFNNGAVTFSTRFASSRLNSISQLAANEYRLTIEPENAPINNSPWYAFTVTSQLPQIITLHFAYKEGSHRYHPKLSRDGSNWQYATEQQYQLTETGEAQLTVNTGPQTLWIAAQELNYSVAGLRTWMADYAQKPFISRRPIGESVQGRPLEMLVLGNPNADYSLALLGRQHPPEVTGSIAQLAFVARLADDSELAQRFRQQFKTLIFPLMNPDGVANGNWRHNMNGVDLNRDWYTAIQPETIVVMKLLRAEATAPDKALLFALDFHSTRKDVIYSVNRELVDDNYRIVDQWVAQIKHRFPDYPLNDKPGSLERGVSKNWLFKALRVPAVTYEAGDETPRDTIQEIADYAATALMTLLLEKVEQTR